MVFEKDLTTKHKAKKKKMTMNTLCFCQAEPALEHNFVSIDLTKFPTS